MTLQNQNFRLCTAAILLAIAAPQSATAQGADSLFGLRSASVTYGPYARLEVGGASPRLDNAYWLPPGEDDPEISFDADGERAGFGSIAIGYDWQTGVRADLSIFGTGTIDVAAPCSGTSDDSACAVHASITDASVQTRGIMANVYYAPLEAQGSHSVFQPFIVAGLGVARNEVGDWTRESTTSGRPVRVFEGDTSTEFAWSVGLGAALQVTKPGDWPVIVEASWRYYDFGTASGGAAALAGGGSSQPQEPFTFDHNEHVFTIGIRIPLERY